MKYVTGICLAHRDPEVTVEMQETLEHRYKPSVRTHTMCLPSLLIHFREPKENQEQMASQ